MTAPPSSLPSGLSPSLGLVRATSQERLEQWTKNGAVWRGALSLESYLRREHVLISQEALKDGGIIHWVLVDTAVPEKDRVVLAGCETYRKKAVVRQNGKLREVLAHGVGSVFAPPEFRGRGYGQRMMEELAKALKRGDADNGKGKSEFSVLYSDIGKNFYSSFGWQPFRSSHISLPAIASSASTNGSVSNGNLPSPRPLYEFDLPELCAIDEKLLRQSMEAHPPKNSKAAAAVALIPETSTIRWHHAREDFVAQDILGRFPTVKGGIVGDEVGKRVWCYWTRMWYNSDPSSSTENTLHILRLVVEDQSQSYTSWNPETVQAVAALLAMAQKQAGEWNMEHAEIWNPDEGTVQAAKMVDANAKVTDRDQESIASLLWYGQPVCGEGEKVVEHLEWVANEKHGWC